MLSYIHKQTARRYAMNFRITFTDDNNAGSYSSYTKTMMQALMQLSIRAKAGYTGKIVEIK